MSEDKHNRRKRPSSEWDQASLSDHQETNKKPRLCKSEEKSKPTQHRSFFRRVSDCASTEATQVKGCQTSQPQGSVTLSAGFLPRRVSSYDDDHVSSSVSEPTPYTPIDSSLGATPSDCSVGEDMELVTTRALDCAELLVKLEETRLQNASVMSTKRNRRLRDYPFLFVMLLLLAATLLGNSGLQRPRQTAKPDSIYVSGGGFSGFWFSIGRLQSIPEKESKTYYCYSAGCLAVVSALSNATLEQMTEVSFGVQRRWQSGETSLHQVVSDFLETLLTQKNVIALGQNPTLLSKIKIITTVKNPTWGVKSVIRSPLGLEDLQEMLLQTTWLPFFLGHRLWHTDSSTGEKHMDGVFMALHDHPLCSHHVGLAWDWELQINSLNVNMGPDVVKKLWNRGLDYGL